MKMKEKEIKEQITLREFHDKARVLASKAKYYGLEVYIKVAHDGTVKLVLEEPIVYILY